MDHYCQVREFWSWLDITKSYLLCYMFLSITSTDAASPDHLVGGHIGSDELQAVAEVALLSAEVALGTEGLDAAEKLLDKTVSC